MTGLSLRTAALASTALAWLVSSVLLSACQVVPFEEPVGSTSDDGSTEPAIDPVYNCDPTNTASCASNQKCTVLEVAGVQNVYDCVDDDGTLMPYQACTPAPTTGQDSCSKGLVCIAETAGELMGFCMPMCDTQQECNGVCAASPELNIPLCGDACDPLAQDCPVVLECHPEDDNWGCQFRGDTHDGSVLDFCDALTLDGCSEGLYCAQGSLVNECEFQNCCTRMCALDTGEGCESPHECVALTGAPPEAANVGICIVPS